MGDFTGAMLGSLLVVAVVLVVIFLVFREVICWYWKINRSVALLTEIRDLLAAKGVSDTSPKMDNPDSAGVSQRNPAEVRAQAERESRNAAENLAANGRTVEQISKELERWRGISPAEAMEIAKSAKKEGSSKPTPHQSPSVQTTTPATGASQSSSGLRCPACDAAIAVDERFCGACGTKVA